MNEISEGLKRARAKGESIEQAKASFVNAGHDASEVESAANMLSSPTNEIIPKPKKIVRKIIQRKKPKPGKTIQKVSNYIQPEKPEPKFQQKVSKYEDKPKFNWIFLIMVIIFLILLGILAAVFFFKPNLSELVKALF